MVSTKVSNFAACQTGGSISVCLGDSWGVEFKVFDFGIGLGEFEQSSADQKEVSPPSHQFILRGLSGSIACTAPMYLEAVSIEETGSRGGRRRVLFETHCLKLRFAICRLETGESEQMKGPRWP